MARVTPVRAGSRGGRPGPPPRPWWPAAAAAGGAAAVVLALYLALPLLQGYQLPVGPDGPVYSWWTRYAATIGLEGIAPGRPGVPAAAVVLGTAFGIEAEQTLSGLGPVLAAACGLAAAALLEASLGPSRLRSAVAVVVTGAFAAYLAGGWLANLAQAALFLAALAAFALAQRSWRPVFAGAGLLAAAGLAHRIFLLVALVIMVGVVLAHLPEAIRARRAGGRARDSVAFRLVLGGSAGASAAALGMAAVSAPAAVAGDTSQDGFFRRLGLDGLLSDRYRERLAGDATRAGVPAALGVTLGALSIPRLRGAGWSQAQEGPRYVASLVASWAAVTVLGVGLLAFTGWGPPNRMLVFGFFLPLAAAVGIEAMASRGRAAAALGIVAALAFAGVAMWGWYRQAPSVSEGELAVARRAGAVVDRLPPGTPVIFLVDTSEPAAAFHVTRFGNVIRMGMPPERLPDTAVAVGTPEDYLAGRTTLTGDEEHDRITRDYLRRTEPVRGRAAVFVLAPFNPSFGTGPGSEVAPGVIRVGGLPTRVDHRPPVSGQLPVVSPTELVLLSIATLALLAVLGGGWARWALPGGGPGAVIGLAPATGLAECVAGGVGADILGPGPGAPWGLIAAAALGAVGYGIAALAPMHRDPAGEREPAAAG